LDIFERIKRELLRQPDNKWSALLFEACDQLQTEATERAKNEKAKYDFTVDPGRIVCSHNG
jgi:hypothetical protein